MHELVNVVYIPLFEAFCVARIQGILLPAALIFCRIAEECAPFGTGLAACRTLFHRGSVARSHLLVAAFALTSVVQGHKRVAVLAIVQELRCVRRSAIHWHRRRLTRVHLAAQVAPRRAVVIRDGIAQRILVTRGLTLLDGLVAKREPFPILAGSARNVLLPRGRARVHETHQRRRARRDELVNRG